MNSMKLWIPISCLLLLFAVNSETAAQTFPRGVSWKQVRTEHFIVVFRDAHRELIPMVTEMVESVHQEMSRFFNYRATKTLYVVLSDYLDTFDRLDLLATQRARKDRIVLFLSDLSHGAPSFDILLQKWLTVQFIYQYTYVIRHRMDMKLRVLFSTVYPDAGFAGWMEGGMALFIGMWLAGDLHRSPYLEMILRTEILEHDFEALEQHTAVGARKWPGDLALFTYGYSFLLYLSETYGEESLTRLNQLQNTYIPRPSVLGQKPFENIYGKRWSDIEQDWRAALQDWYDSQINEIESRPLTSSEPLSTSGSLTGAPLFSPDGQFAYYIEDDPYADPGLVQLRFSDRDKRRLIDGRFSGAFSLTADGQQLYFCKTDGYQLYYRVSDLYVLDLATRHVRRLTKGTRAFDPAIAPDGKTLVYVTIEAGKTSLMTMDLASGQHAPLFNFPRGVQVRKPVFSSDGTTLALQVLNHETEGDGIYLINHDGTDLRPVLVDGARYTSPKWGPHDASLLVSSDRTGVPNIFAYSLHDQQLSQVTNLLTGGFQPAISPDGQSLLFTKYSSRGLDVHLTKLDSHLWPTPPLHFQESPAGMMAIPVQEVPVSSETRYNPWRSLFSMPLVVPILGTDEDGYQVGVYVKNSDVLDIHEYNLSLLYGIRSGRVQWDGEYWYNRFRVQLGLFGYDRAEKYAWYYQSFDKEQAAYWERQQAGGIILGTPLFRTQRTELSLGVGYAYEQFRPLTDPPPEDQETPVPESGVLTDLAARLVLKSFDVYRSSTSPESGVLASLEHRWYDTALGGDYNINAWSGDLRLYIDTPFPRHVLTLRAAGGLSEGGCVRVL